VHEFWPLLRRAVKILAAAAADNFGGARAPSVFRRWRRPMIPAGGGGAIRRLRGLARMVSGPRCGCRRAWLELERTLLLTAYIVIDEVSNDSKVYDLEWPNQYLRFFAADFREIKLLPDVSAAMSIAATSTKWNKLLPAHSVSIEIYSAIAQFTCDNTDFLLSKSGLSRLKSI